jgi:hypothetical protein
LAILCFVSELIIKGNEPRARAHIGSRVRVIKYSAPVEGSAFFSQCREHSRAMVSTSLQKKKKKKRPNHSRSTPSSTSSSPPLPTRSNPASTFHYFCPPLFFVVDVVRLFLRRSRFTWRSQKFFISDLPFPSLINIIIANHRDNISTLSLFNGFITRLINEGRRTFGAATLPFIRGIFNRSALRQ